MVDQVLMLQIADINATAAGDNIIIPKSPNQKFYIYGWTYVCSNAVNVKWMHGATSYHTALTFGQFGSWDKDSMNGSPLLVVPEGEDFILNLSGAIPVTGIVWYKPIAVETGLTV